jgi:hypothetical protein
MQVHQRKAYFVPFAFPHLYLPAMLQIISFVCPTIANCKILGHFALQCYVFNSNAIQKHTSKTVIQMVGLNKVVY